MTLTQKQVLNFAEIAEKYRQVDPAVTHAIQMLIVERQGLLDVMMAAAVEIDSQWEAHCDDEGYGPVNLMHRLESGISTEYGYVPKVQF